MYGIASVTARTQAAAAITRYVQDQGWTQTEAARVFGITQPRMCNLLTGRVDKFSLDALVDLLAVAGYTFDIRTIDDWSTPQNTEGSPYSSRG